MVNEDIPLIAQGMTASYKAGMESERRMLTQDILLPIFRALEMAERDPQAKIPSVLMAAIVSARAKFK
jgi:hypothetical protein